MLENRSEKGQSAVIIAFIVLVLLALVAVVVDVGNAYAHRRMLQNAVDAAAMAGARQMAENGISRTVSQRMVWLAIDTFATENGLLTDNWSANFVDNAGDNQGEVLYWNGPLPGSATGVQVAGILPFDTYFAHLLGFDELTAGTDATAWLSYGPCSGWNLFPVILENIWGANGPEPSEEFTLWDKNDRPDAPGNFGWLYWEDDDGVNRCPYDDCLQNSNTTCLSANILDNTRSGDWAVGDWINGNTGVSMQPVLSELDSYIQSGGHVLIPMYEEVTGTGNNTYFRISGFAAFRLTCAYNGQNQLRELYDGTDGEHPASCGPCNDTGNSNDKCIRGEFVEKVVPGAGADCPIDAGIVIPSFQRPAP